jgi:hypothetical protein
VVKSVVVQDSSPILLQVPVFLIYNIIKYLLFTGNISAPSCILHFLCHFYYSDLLHYGLCSCCSSQWSETVSELWPPMGILFIPKMMYEYGEP